MKGCNIFFNALNYILFLHYYPLSHGADFIVVTVSVAQITLSSIYYYFVIIIHSGVRLSPLGTVATIDLLYQPQMIR
jgi:urease accessory protein UreF